MNAKTFGLLSAVSAVLIVLAFIGQGRGGSGSIAGASAGTALFPGLAQELDSISGIVITGAGSEQLVSLERSDGTWRVTELGGYTAERASTGALLIALAEARIVEEKTRDPAFHARLGVEDIAADDATGMEIALLAGDGSRYAAILGDAYTGGQRYARASGSDQSVLIDQNPDISPNPSDWVDRSILDIEAGRVQRVRITHADGETLVMRRSSRDDRDFAVDDIPEGRELQYAGVANVSGNLLDGLRLEGVEAVSGEPGEPLATTEFRTFDGLVITVFVETLDDENSWLRFAASFDAAQAAEFAAEGAADDSAPAGNDVAGEADAVNERLSGWRYRIASYQLSQLTRRIDDLLRPVADE